MDKEKNSKKTFVAVPVGRLYVTHLYAVYKSCLDRVEEIMSLEGNFFKLDEREIADTPCDCNCPVDVTTRIEGLGPNIYTIKAYQGGVQVSAIVKAAI